MTGRLIGIARKGRPRAVPELIGQARIDLRTGIAGDYRGALKPDGPRKRQVTLMLAEDWRAALADLGRDDIAWQLRRVNLLVDGVALPHAAGDCVRVGTALLEVTGECDPCSRMEEVAPGLRAVLTPGWRGGRLMRVIEAGDIAIGDAVAIEHHRMQEAI